MPTKLWIFVNNIALSAIMSVLLSICLTVGQGISITPMGFLMTFAWAFGTSVVVAYLVPLARIGAWFAKNMSAEPGSGIFYLFECLLQVTFFLVIVDLVMTFALTGFGDIGGFTWFDRWWMLNMQFWAIALVCYFVARPLSAALASKASKD